MLLSVVVPFYHVEAYIDACLEELGRLPEEMCEILLVDDCGRDASAEIAGRFCAEHGNARVIRREKNGGLSAARNTGLDQASGEYVYFLDSDDIPVPDALMALVQEAKEKRLDIAKARFLFYDDETGKESPGPAICSTDVMSGGVLFASQCRDNLYEPMVWQCVYRLDFLRVNGLRMADGLQFEDELFQAPALLKAERAAAFEQVILRYRQREGSIMGAFAKSSRWCANYLEVCRRLRALCESCENGEARSALKRRTGQIALSTVKNITAYGLKEKIAADAVDFAAKNKKELSLYAIKSGDMLVAVQGLLLRFSLTLFMRLYSRK